MTKGNTGSGKKLVSRREFLIGGGAVLAAVALVACTTKSSSTTTSTTTSTTAPSSSVTTTAVITPTESTTSAPSTTTTQPTATVTTPKRGGVLKINYQSGPSGSIGWTPDMAASGGGEEIVLQPCFEPLLRSDAKGAISSWLAESYTVADDLKSITFNLRRGVNFHDGSDFNSEVAKWNLDNIIGAKVEPTWSSVDIIDNYTIRLNITAWNNTILNSIADRDKSWMVSKASFDKNGIDWIKQNPVGTGPFKFISFQRDAGIKFIKNPNYWNKDAQGNQLPYLEGVEFTFVADPTIKKMLIQTGGADLIDIENTKDASDIKKLGLSVNASVVGLSGLLPDSANPDSPWAIQKVREAAEYAINREEIANAFGYGYLQAPYQIPPIGNAAYDPNFSSGRKYDADKAKQLLAEAGFSTGFKTTLIAMPFGLNRDIVAGIQNYLAKVNIQAELEFPDPGKWMTYQFGNWRNALLWSGPPIFANFNQSLSFFFLPSNVAVQSWLRTPGFTQALNASLASRTMNADLIRAVTNIMSKDASFIPVCNGIQGWTFQPYVMNISDLNRSLPTFVNYEQIWLNK